MRDEAFNFVDGKRSILEIYRAVRVESHSVDEWYCGTVSSDDIGELLN